MSAISRFREAVKNNDIEDAVYQADDIVKAMGDESPAEIFTFLDSAAEKSHSAAFVCATTFLFRPEPVSGHRFKLLLKAARSKERFIASSAHMCIGLEYLASSENKKKAIPALRKSFEMGNLESALVLADAYEAGVFGKRNSLAHAFSYLSLAVEEEYGPAKLSLAEFLVRNELTDTEYSPVELLREAVEENIEGAAEYLASYIEVEKIAYRLPKRVIPASMDRPNAVVDCLNAEFPVPERLLKALVAEWHGFESWKSLERAVSKGDSSSGPADEDCSQEELLDRRMRQTMLLSCHILAPTYVLDTIVGQLRPTAREGKPSLANLEELVNQRMDFLMEPPSSEYLN